MFNGKPKKKKVVSLGGTKRTVDKQELLKENLRARQEREELRQQQAAALSLQKCARGFIARSRLAKRIDSPEMRAEAVATLRHLPYLQPCETAKTTQALAGLLIKQLPAVLAAIVGNKDERRMWSDKLLLLASNLLKLPALVQTDVIALTILLGQQGLAKELDHESMQQFVGHGACRLLCQHILVAKGQLQTILFGLLAIMIGRAPQSAVEQMMERFLCQPLPSSLAIGSLPIKIVLEHWKLPSPLEQLQLYHLAKNLMMTAASHKSGSWLNTHGALYRKSLLSVFEAFSTQHVVVSSSQRTPKEDDEDDVIAEDDSISAFELLCQDLLEPGYMHMLVDTSSTSELRLIAPILAQALFACSDVRKRMHALTTLAVRPAFLQQLYLLVQDMLQPELQGGARVSSSELTHLIALFAKTATHSFGIVDDQGFKRHVETFDSWVKFSAFLSWLKDRLLSELWDSKRSSTPEVEQLIDFGSALLEHFFQRDTRLHLFPEGFWAAPHVVDLVTPALRELSAEEYDQATRVQGEGDADEDSDDIIVRQQFNKTATLKMLKHLSFCMPFFLRVTIFQCLTQQLPGARMLSIRVNRETIYEDAFDELAENIHMMRGRIGVSIRSNGEMEPGIDGGGLFRELVHLVLREGFNPERGLFMETDEHTLFPNPNSALTTPQHEKHMRFLGALLARVVMSNMLADVSLAPFFLASARGDRAGLNDLSSLDSNLYRNLLSVKNYDGDVAELGLSFAVTGDEMSGRQVIDLVPNGQDTDVVTANKLSYVFLMADYYLNRRIERQTRAFVRGMHDVIPAQYWKMFQTSELQLLINGTESEIDVEDWRKYARYSRYDPSDQTIVDFWDVVADMTQEQKRNLLSFVTSCPRAPVMGFQGMAPPFTISNSVDTARMPTASTCMNLLKLPPYADKAELKRKLLESIAQHHGFGLS